MIIKKAISLFMALGLALSMSVTAFAGDNVEYTPTEAKNAVQNITKTYTSDESNYIPRELLEFKVEADSENPDTPMVTVGENGKNQLQVESNTTSYDLSINLPSYDTAGVYRYTITEEKGISAGVTYSDATIHVIVMVEYDNDNNCLKIGNVDSYIEKVDGTKTDKFENKYETGDVSVSKSVTGNMADKNDTFTVKYTLYSKDSCWANVTVAGKTISGMQFSHTGNASSYSGEITICAADGEKTFADLPKGMTVTIEEVTDENGNVDGYSLVGYKVNDGASQKTAPVVTVGAESNDKVVITNNKGEEINTGIRMDSIPYVIVAVIAVLGTAVVVMKKRFDTED